MYRPSKFNYVLRNKDEDVLLYNSFKGSFGKVSRENSQVLLDWIDNKAVDWENENFKRLENMGFFVPDSQDEDIKLSLIDSSSNNLSLIILPTEQCNFRCTYCYEEFKRGKMSDETQIAISSYIRKNISSYNSLNVSWFGGEPLAALDVIENLSEKFMKTCKDLKRSYLAGITTNGYLLNLSTFQKLLKYNVLNYQITIDGIKETHNKQKPLAGGGETFDTVIGNLKVIKKNIKTGRFKIVIRTNVTKEIYDSIDEYIEYFHDVFGDDDRFQFFFRSAGDWGGDSVKDIHESLLDTRGLKVVYEKFVEHEKNFNYMYRNFFYPNGSACYAGKANSFVIAT